MGVQKETYSAVSAETRHKHVSKLPQRFLACLLSTPYLSAEVTGSGDPATDLLKPLSPGVQELSASAGNLMILGRETAFLQKATRKLTKWLKEQDSVTATQTQENGSRCTGMQPQPPVKWQNISFSLFPSGWWEGSGKH